MTTRFKPLGDRVLVEPIEREDRTESGLFIPETAREKPQQGKVIAIGDGRRDPAGSRIPMEIALGDTVLYARYAGTEVKMEGKKFLILRESDVLSVVEG